MYRNSVPILQRTQSVLYSKDQFVNAVQRNNERKL